MVIPHQHTSSRTTATAMARAPLSTQRPGQRRAAVRTPAVTPAMTSSARPCSPASMASPILADGTENLRRLLRYWPVRPPHPALRATFPALRGSIAALYAPRRHCERHAARRPEGDRRGGLDRLTGRGELESREDRG